MSYRHLLSFSIYSLTCHLALALTPLDLRCDDETDPIGASATPKLTWKLESETRGINQAAWQILVASSPELLEENEADFWDSGKVSADRQKEIVYQGTPLTSGKRCHWKVRCWADEDDEATWSSPAVWEVAPQSPADWQGARWIDDGQPLPSADEDLYKADPAPLLRYEFSLSKPVVHARLHVAGLGWCVPSLNGEVVGDHILDPPWTAFEKRILFSTHDVTEQLKSGSNCLGLELGNGWFNPLPLRMWGHRNIRESLTTGRPRAIACLIVDHPDGTNSKITTGDGWTWTKGPLLSNSVYLGEVYDAQQEQPGWNTPGFNASKWTPVRLVDAPLDQLENLSVPPVRAGEELPAVAITTPIEGIHIVDFGRNFTGVPDIRFNLKAGDRITLRYGEVLNPDGSLNPLTSVCGQIKGVRKGKEGIEVPMGGPGAPPIAWQQDVYIARGGGPEHYRPNFTFHGFRFMEITGMEKSPTTSDFKGIPLRTDLKSAGSFTCSNERLNEIQKICQNTFLSNVVSVQSDCPHRERFAYGGDIVSTSEAFLMNFDMAAFYAKTVRDWADGSRPDGNFTDTAPFVGINYCGVGWAMVHPLLLEQLHQHYGNRELLVEQLPYAIRWLDLEAKARKEGLVIKGLGDHEALAKSGGPAITTPMFIDSARRIARLARIIGDDKNAARMDQIADESATAWARSFLDPATGIIGEGSQSHQAIALGFGSVPEASKAAVFNHLVKKLGDAKAPQLTTGIFGTNFLLDELSQHGRSDIAYRLADRNTFPSWGWMLENDATTLWEHWAGSDGTFSHNHPMFGSISAWFFRWLGGIQPADDAVGFDRAIISPQTVEGLEWVNCSHQTIHGIIESNWKISPSESQHEIVIPPNVSALVRLPKEPGDTILEGGAPVEQTDGAEVLKSTDSEFQIRLGSGHYRFTIKHRP